MINDWIKGINLQKLAITAVVMFIYIALSDVIVHGWWLAGTYRDTASLWRSSSDMHSFAGWMWTGQLLVAVLFTFIFIKGYNGTGTAEGFRFGVLIGLFSAGNNFIMYSVIPMPNNLMWAWVLAGLVQGIIGGVLAAFVYGTVTKSKRSRS